MVAAGAGLGRPPQLCVEHGDLQRLVSPAVSGVSRFPGASLDLAGQARFGPNVEWLEAKSVSELDYSVDVARAESFYQSIRQYWPNLRNGALMPAYSGIRPKVTPLGTDSDFIVRHEGHHNVKGLINLFGIESPGLTASLAIARYVWQLLRDV